MRFTISPWERAASRVLVDNRWLRLRQDDCRLPDGRTVEDYHVLEEADVACVVALTPTGDVLLVEQYKHGIGRVCLEIPGGQIDAADADPLAAGRRELAEETGFTAPDGDWHGLGAYAVSPARSTVRMHLAVALNCRPTAAPKPDPAEQIRVHQVSWDEAMRLVDDGVIHACTTLAGLFAARRWLDARPA